MRKVSRIPATMTNRTTASSNLEEAISQRFSRTVTVAELAAVIAGMR
jgi:hypothetical protein